MKTIKLTHKQAMEVVACLDTLQGMGGTLDEKLSIISGLNIMDSRDNFSRGSMSKRINPTRTRHRY